MKLVVKVIVFIFLLTIGFPGMGSAQEDEQPTDPSEIQLQMGVISDTHIGVFGNDRLLRSVLSDYAAVTPNLDALAVVGDFTHRGLVTEYNLFNQILQADLGSNVEKVVAIGNHEFFEKRFYPQTNLTVENMKDRFITYMQDYGEIDRVYYDKWVKGYHFIVLGSEDVHPASWDLPVISEEQYIWLEEKMQEDASPDKPIFVFLHQPIDNTITCSEDWGAKFKDNRLKSILQQYPQSFLFSGHTHCLTDHPRIVYQDGFTMVGTGSISKNKYANGIQFPVNNEQSDGLFVNVYHDRVEIMGRNFDTKTGTFSHTVDLPYNFEKELMDDEPPSFAADVDIEFERITTTSAAVTWKPANDNTQVDKYEVYINGKFSQTVFNEFWTNDVVQAHSIVLENLQHNEDYLIEIVAVDAWHNRSLPLQKNLPKLSDSNWFSLHGVLYYVHPDTNELATGWTEIDGEYFYFNEDGSMKTGFLDDGQERYYFDKSGKTVAGWQNIDGDWYFFDKDRHNAMVTGWLKDKNHWYFLKADGRMATKWEKVNNTFYFFNASGVMQTGWLKTNGYWHYLHADGGMAIGWLKKDGQWYYLDEEGKMATQWAQVKDDKYYFNGRGEMLTGWQSINGTWYHLEKSGRMTVGWLQEKGKWYFLKDSGAMAVNWAEVKDKWYLFNSSGVMQSGWKTLNGQTFFMRNSGEMVTDWQLLNGKWYFFKTNGALVKNWEMINDKWYFFNGKGEMMTNWVLVKGIWYYFTPSGAMATGWQRINHQWYFLKDSGAMHIGWLAEDQTWYYLNPNGTMATGSKRINGKTYVFTSSGVLLD